MVEIADDGANDWMETKCGYKVDREAVDRSRLRVEARKWLMGANQPWKYDEKVELKHTGAGDNPVAHTFILKIDNS
jgi:hypothetical protein